MINLLTCIDGSTAPFSALQLFKNDDASTLANDKTATVGIKRARRTMGLISKLGGERTRLREAGNSQRRYQRVRAASYHHVGVAVANETKRVANGMRARRAGCGH